MRIGWLTDLHLNFVPASRRRAFYARLRDEKLDGVLIGGDIGEADCTPDFLTEMENAFGVPVYFVLGNHDFYRGSIAGVRRAMSGRPGWLSQNGVIALTPTTALIGHDSWADGRCGDFFASEVMLNDYLLIDEFRGLDKPARYAKLNALGDEAAEVLERRTQEAVARFGQVILLTHVPPFREACWHEGRISDDDWLPHFACRAVGERLVEVMRQHPERQLTVLCGHTHSAGSAQILDNLTVRTGRAVYGEPALQRIIEI